MKIMYKFLRTMITGPRFYLGEGGAAAAESDDGDGDGEMTTQDLHEAVSDGIDTILDGDGDENGEGEQGQAASRATGDGEGEAGADGDGESGSDKTGDGVTGDGDSGDGEGGDNDATRLSAGDDADKDKDKDDPYAIPEGLNERSQGRFTKLVDSNKQKDEHIGQLTETVQGFHQMVQNTGMDNHEFMDAITIMGTVKKDPAAGIKALQGVIESISKEHGIEITKTEFDILDEYPDLKQDVEDLHITRERAMELINSRRTKARTDEQTSRDDERNNKVTEYNEAKKEAVPALTKFLDDAQKNDIDWAPKHELMMEAAKFASKNLHPKDWLPHMKAEYEKISRIASSVSGNKGKGNQPLMGNSSVRGGQKEPTDIGSWIDNNL